MPNLTSTTLEHPTGTYYIELPHYSALWVQGPDAVSFLQGQLTADINQQDSQHWQLTGHCNAQGKLWSISRLIGESDTYQLIMPQANLLDSLRELNKFAVFSKLTCTDRSSEQCWFAIWGSAARQQAEKLTGLSLANRTAAWNDLNTVLELTPDLILCSLANQPAVELQPASWWTALCLHHGWPELPPEQAGQHVPQMLNLDKLGGINWQKGCYIGQETVARMHYKGQVKRRMYTLTGTAETLPEPGQTLERAMGENWRRAGAVLAAVRYDDDVVALQAVLPADTAQECLLRIKGQDDSKFTICPTQAEITESS